MPEKGLHKWEDHSFVAVQSFRNSAYSIVLHLDSAKKVSSEMPSAKRDEMR